jgi:hypothetical protein
MKIDVARAVGAAVREVKGTERGGRRARVVVATRVYDTDVDVTVDGQAWAAGGEGRAFQRLCSDDWGRASIAAGTDAQQAREAAARTTAAYLGEA